MFSNKGTVGRYQAQAESHAILLKTNNNIKHLEVHKIVFPEREQDDARELRAVPEKGQAKRTKKIDEKNTYYIAKETGKVRKTLEAENQPIFKALRPYGK